MSRVLGSCRFCTEPVQEHQRPAFYVHGWEVTREQGGANKIVGKQRQKGIVAHGRCAERAADLDRKGLRGQEGLL